MTPYHSKAPTHRAVGHHFTLAPVTSLLASMLAPGQAHASSSSTFTSGLLDASAILGLPGVSPAMLAGGVTCVVAGGLIWALRRRSGRSGAKKGGLKAATFPDDITNDAYTKNNKPRLHGLSRERYEEPVSYTVETQELGAGLRMSDKEVQNLFKSKATLSAFALTELQKLQGSLLEVEPGVDDMLSEAVSFDHAGQHTQALESLHRAMGLEVDQRERIRIHTIYKNYRDLKIEVEAGSAERVMLSQLLEKTPSTKQRQRVDFSIGEEAVSPSSDAKAVTPFSELPIKMVPTAKVQQPFLSVDIPADRPLQSPLTAPGAMAGHDLGAFGASKPLKSPPAVPVLTERVALESSDQMRDLPVLGADQRISTPDPDPFSLPDDDFSLDSWRISGSGASQLQSTPRQDDEDHRGLHEPTMEPVPLQNEVASESPEAFDFETWMRQDAAQPSTDHDSFDDLVALSALVEDVGPHGEGDALTFPATVADQEPPKLSQPEAAAPVLAHPSAAGSLGFLDHGGAGHGAAQAHEDVAGAAPGRISSLLAEGSRMDADWAEATAAFAPGSLGLAGADGISDDVDLDLGIDQAKDPLLGGLTLPNLPNLAQPGLSQTAPEPPMLFWLQCVAPTWTGTAWRPGMHRLTVDLSTVTPATPWPSREAVSLFTRMAAERLKVPENQVVLSAFHPLFKTQTVAFGDKRESIHGWVSLMVANEGRSLMRQEFVRLESQGPWPSESAKVALEQTLSDLFPNAEFLVLSFIPL